MVFALSNIISGKEFCASLTDYDSAGLSRLAVKKFNTQELGL